MTSAVLASVLFSIATAVSASAQDSRLVGRVDSATGAAIARLMDGARANHLPTEPLLDKALEGVEKGAEPSRILEAVRQFAADLETARTVLGTGAGDSELEAGASALSGGIPARELSRIRLAAPNRALTTTLTVVSDLVARNVPEAQAVNALVSLVAAGVQDQDLRVFQRNVRSDIDRGADPATATSTRAHAMRLQVAGGHSKPL